MNGDQTQSVSGGCLSHNLRGSDGGKLDKVALKKSKLQLKSRFKSNVAKVCSEWQAY
jgi:hypothetical protein